MRLDFIWVLERTLGIGVRMKHFRNFLQVQHFYSRYQKVGGLRVNSGTVSVIDIWNIIRLLEHCGIKEGKSFIQRYFDNACRGGLVLLRPSEGKWKGVSNPRAARVLKKIEWWTKSSSSQSLTHHTHLEVEWDIGVGRVQGKTVDSFHIYLWVTEWHLWQ